MFNDLCPPALIYLVFSFTQIVIDTIKGYYNMATMKLWVAFVFTILLLNIQIIEKTIDRSGSIPPADSVTSQ